MLSGVTVSGTSVCAGMQMQVGNARRREVGTMPEEEDDPSCPRIASN